LRLWDAGHDSYAVLIVSTIEGQFVLGCISVTQLPRLAEFAEDNCKRFRWQAANKWLGLIHL
jgi:hypothetical protein